jgi:hypothetical protein
MAIILYVSVPFQTLPSVNTKLPTLISATLVSDDSDVSDVKESFILKWRLKNKKCYIIRNNIQILSNLGFNDRFVTVEQDIQQSCLSVFDEAIYNEFLRKFHLENV